MYKVGDKIEAFDYPVGEWRSGKIIRRRENVACCETENRHYHPVVYDVRLTSGRRSRGHLPHSIRLVSLPRIG